MPPLYDFACQTKKCKRNTGLIGTDKCSKVELLVKIDEVALCEECSQPMEKVISAPRICTIGCTDSSKVFLH